MKETAKKPSKKSLAKKTKSELIELISGTPLPTNQFRISIFGSARLQPTDKAYKDVYSLAEEIGKKGFDVITGGGPGIMEAANAGHGKGDKKNVAKSIGITVKLPFEENFNDYLEYRKHFTRFSNRLDEFMILSNVAIIATGGIGTCLELFYTWQLTQVKHICPIPIILYGEMWLDLIEWIKKHLLKNKLISPGDLDNIFVACNKEEAMKIIMNTHEIFKQEGGDYCINYRKYKLD